ncbi:SlyX family protein [Pseudodesulfovibrio senegalensis]|jgi:SlyX protein|uniref:SlyX family protein n=1 Tax=Pseudodesulfovibrio senegalensis TaxID=1721087 RepID=A0A6N6N2J9_9BACT|nr:SlyX family protein [Pseudodesulfovibrio senegalensis]KAB1441662.1 SlyX family protein [Pseudodesulfovibrio senegalensis]
MEDRIERLESAVAQQDNTIEELNRVVFDQQKQIDELEKKLELLAAKFREMAEAQDTGFVDTPPPHYGGRS